MSATAEDFDDEYDEYYDDDDGISGFVVLVVAVAAVAVSLAIAAIAYQRGIQVGASENMPVIAADPTPARTEQPLLTNGPDRQEVYDRLEGNVPSEIIMAAQSDRDPLEGFSETISAAEQTATRIGQAGSAVVGTATSQVAQALDEPVRMANSTRRTVETATLPLGTPLATPQPARQVPVPVIKASVLSPKPLPAIVQPSPQTAPRSTAPSTTGRGTHVVQVGAFRSESEAARYFEKMRGKFGSFLNDKTSDVQRADLGAKGIYYRLRVAPFSSKDAAQSYCTSLKSGGQDCLVKAL